MKNITIAASTTLFLLLALSNATELVLDAAGNQLKAKQRYYIIQRNRGAALGLTFAGANNRTCPHPRRVVRVPYQPSNNDGLPVTITPVKNKDGSVHVSTDVNIKFWTSFSCPESNVWKLGNRDEATGQYFITGGGVEGNPGRKTISNWFKIEKVDYDYKLVFCPTVCKECRPMCGDIGVYSDDDQLPLGLSEFPLRIFFKKA